jgi:hypothetical protein
MRALLYQADNLMLLRQSPKPIEFFLPSQNCQTLGDAIFVPSPYSFRSWQITTFAK